MLRNSSHSRIWNVLFVAFPVVALVDQMDFQVSYVANNQQLLLVCSILACSKPSFIATNLWSSKVDASLLLIKVKEQWIDVNHTAHSLSRTILARQFIELYDKELHLCMKSSSTVNRREAEEASLFNL